MRSVDLICRAVLSLGVAASATARLCGLRLVEVLRSRVRPVDEAVCRPRCVVDALAEFYAHKEASVFLTGVDIHVSLVALIYPLNAAHICAAVGAGDGYYIL